MLSNVPYTLAGREMYGSTPPNSDIIGNTSVGPPSFDALMFHRLLGEGALLHEIEEPWLGLKRVSSWH